MTRTLTLWVVVVMAAALGFWFMADVTAQTPEPAPKLAYSKTAGADVQVGGAVVYTISITNSGNADSGSQTIEDQLDEDVDWETLFETNLECDIDSDNFLTCYTESVPKRDLIPGTETFANGVASVTIYGVPDTCGNYPNEAVFYNGRSFAALRAATARVLCPPTATPTATNTPVVIVVTATPTSTMPIVATNTPSQSQPTSQPESTPTTRIVPLPPNTGTGPSSGAPVGLILATALTLMIVGVGVGIYGRR